MRNQESSESGDKERKRQVIREREKGRQREWEERDIQTR